LWLANGNQAVPGAEGYPGEVIITNPDSIPPVNASKAPISIGPLYEAAQGDTLAGVAAQYRSTVKSILSLNPDLAPNVPDSWELTAGQQLCVLPCSKRRVDTF